MPTNSCVVFYFVVRPFRVVLILHQAEASHYIFIISPHKHKFLASSESPAYLIAEVEQFWQYFAFGSNVQGEDTIGNATQLLICRC